MIETVDWRAPYSEPKLFAQSIPVFTRLTRPPPSPLAPGELHVPSAAPLIRSLDYVILSSEIR